eukprot:scaffold229053_cov32-Tisochrysis_lutea.AAC.1
MPQLRLRVGAKDGARAGERHPASGLLGRPHELDRWHEHTHVKRKPACLLKGASLPREPQRVECGSALGGCTAQVDGAHTRGALDASGQLLLAREEGVIEPAWREHRVGRQLREKRAAVGERCLSTTKQGLEGGGGEGGGRALR